MRSPMTRPRFRPSRPFIRPHSWPFWSIAMRMPRARALSAADERHMSMPLPQPPAHAAEVPLPERVPQPGAERTISPALWGALGRFGIPVLALAIILGFVTIAITRWDLWTAQAAVQETDNAYVRTEMTRLAS